MIDFNDYFIRSPNNVIASGGGSVKNENFKYNLNV